jgi:hypothetical protein
VPGQAPGFTAGRRHHEHVDVPAVLTGEGDPAAVRREGRAGLAALAAGEPHRVAAVTPDQPEIIRVNEDDVIRAHIGIAQQASTLGLCPLDTSKDEAQQEERKERLDRAAETT